MTNQVPHPIQLHGVVFTRSVVIAIPNHVQEPGAVIAGPKNSITVAKNKESPGSYEVTMKVGLNADSENQYPYLLDMECKAIFSADNTLSEEEALRAVYITGHSVAYGAIREAVSWITARQPYGPLILGLSVLQNAPIAEAGRPVLANPAP